MITTAFLSLPGAFHAVACIVLLFPYVIAARTPSLPVPIADDAGTYDFIIVGGGTAGLALAARLTENISTTVLVLEAGMPPDIVKSYKTPGAVLQLLGSPIDWAFTTIPQPTLNGRQIRYSRGRCLGGSSAINGLTYGRGSSGVYDLWERLGSKGWNWDSVFPYFKKSTTFNAGLSNVVGKGHRPSLYDNGPVQIAYPENSYAYPGGAAFVESLSSIGVPVVDDLNNGTNIGAKQEPLTIDVKFDRSSSYDNYYQLSKNRSNLHVLSSNPAQRIILKRADETIIASGVVFLDYASGITYNATASKEVILSAGSVQTPQLLMLSGIGPTETLAKVGIEKILAHENVGQGLQDHTYFSIIVKADSIISYDPLFNDVSKTQGAAAEFQNSTGPFIAPVGLSYAFQKVSTQNLSQIGAGALIANRSDQSHIEYYYETEFYPNGPTPQYSPQQYNTSYVSITAGLLAPLSRGSVSLSSNSISDAPKIDLQYYSSPTDQAIAIYAFRNLRTILAKFATYNFTIGPNNGEVAPGPSVQTDEQILEYIRDTAVTVWHASGTCAMLPRSDGGVVDPRLRVYGVKGLRIVDASIFPVIPDQHTVGPVYMVAEKAADMIKEDWGL